MNTGRILHAAHALALATLAGVCVWGMTHKNVPAWERSVFEVFNDLPRAVWRPLESVMWIGTTLGILVAALVTALLRRHALSTEVLAGGAIAWVAQRALKLVVDRGRPRDLLPDANFWGHLASGGGIPSGHTAMATAVCTVIASRVGRPWRVVCAAVAVLVGIGRMYTGNHLPLDVVSGAALGWLSAWAGIGLTRRIVPRRSTSTHRPADVDDLST